MTHRSSARVLLAAAVALGLGALEIPVFSGLASQALAQADYVDRVNATFSDIGPAKRSDTVLLPLLAKMDKAPKPVSAPSQAALLPAKSPDFAAASAWATAAPQKAVLEALHKVTQEADWKKAYAFGQAYGADGVPPDMIRAKLYTELGDPPLLAAAQHLYMPALDAMVSLTHIEATRLAADGKPSDAIDLLIDLTFFGRQMADRQFFTEVAWGLQTIMSSEERIRDIAYIDVKGVKKIDVARLPDQIKRLNQDDAGYMDLDRLKFPVGNRVGVEQLLARIGARGADTVDPQVFATTMARLGSTEHPLRLFSEAGHWRDAASSQVAGKAATTKANAIFDDWSRRFALEYYDKEQRQPTAYETSSLSTMAAVEAATPDMGALRQTRQLAKVENIGTRQSLALTGVTLANGQIPALLTSVRPRWMAVIEPDPFNIPEIIIRSGGRLPFEYFIPQTLRGKDPHQMQVFTAGGETNFQVSLQNDVWVLYSRGSDNNNDGGRRIQNTAEVVQNADYLIWPPVVSLYRQYLIDKGDIKQ